MERTDWSSKKVTRIPEEEQIVVEGMHEAIVTKEEFLRAQKRFRTGGHVVVVKGDYPLCPDKNPYAEVYVLLFICQKSEWRGTMFAGYD